MIIMYAYFIDISQDSVETHLRCGGIYNNHIIANCLQCAIKRILKVSQQLMKIWTKVKWHVFWPTLYK